MVVSAGAGVGVVVMDVGVVVVEGTVVVERACRVVLVTRWVLDVDVALSVPSEVVSAEDPQPAARRVATTTRTTREVTGGRCRCRRILGALVADGRAAAVDVRSLMASISHTGPSVCRVFIARVTGVAVRRRVGPTGQLWAVPSIEKPQCSSAYRPTCIDADAFDAEPMVPEDPHRSRSDCADWMFCAA